MQDRKLLGICGAGALLAVVTVGFPAVAQAQNPRAPVVPLERPRFNKLANAGFAREPSAENAPLPQWFVVSGASNTAPIELATPIPHDLETGATVAVKGVLGNEAANGWWTITALSPTRFALDGSAGSGTYAGGGSIFPADGQPAPPGPSSDSGELAWTPWFSVPASIPQSEFFRFDVGQGTGEVYTFPQLPTMPEPTPVTSFAAQEIDGSLFRPGEPLCLSIDAKVAAPATDRQKLTLIVTAALNAVRVYRVSFPGTQLNDQYRTLFPLFRARCQCGHRGRRRPRRVPERDGAQRRAAGHVLDAAHALGGIRPRPVDGHRRAHAAEARLLLAGRYRFLNCCGCCARPLRDLSPRLAEAFP